MGLFYFSTKLIVKEKALHSKMSSASVSCVKLMEMLSQTLNQETEFDVIFKSKENMSLKRL